MIYILDYILAGFTAPLEMHTNPESLLLALPLIAVIAVVYKATKMNEIKFRPFIRHSLILSCSIVVFMALIAIGLYIVIKIILG